MADYFQGAAVIAEAAAEIAVGIALSNAQSTYNSIANNYYNIYNTQRTYYFTTFQDQGEAPFATEQFGIQFYNPDYVGNNNVGYFPPGVWYLFKDQLTARINAIGTGTSGFGGYWALYSSRYTSVSENSGTFAMETASILDDWNSYQNRYEEHKRDVFNERRWANRMGSLSYGVKEAYIVERELGTSFEVYDQAQGQLISSYDTILNGLSTSIGYKNMQKAIRDNLGSVPGYQTNSALDNIYG